MRYWALVFVAAALAVVGCGGKGGGGAGLTAGAVTGATTGTTLRVNLPAPNGLQQPPGAIEIAFLTGQGRALGDLTLVIQDIHMADEVGPISNPLSAPTRLPLKGYQNEIVRLDVPFTGQDSRLFESFTLAPIELDQDNGGAVPTPISTFAIADNTVSPPALNYAWPPSPYTIRARVFPGRNTSLPIFIDDSMFSVVVDNTQNPPVTVAAFDETQFVARNGGKFGQPAIAGFISDYVSFDISGMPAAKRPLMSPASGGAPADRLYATGDSYAVSPENPTVPGSFEVFTPGIDPSDPALGRLQGNFGLPGAIGTSPHPGTYSLTALDPSDLNNARKIISLQGTWREYFNVLSNTSGWGMVMFPTSSDGFQQEVVMFKDSVTPAGKHTNTDMYYGYVDYTAKQIHLFPLLTLGTGILTEETILNVTQQLTGGGAVTVSPQGTRSGTYAATGTIGAQFTASGAPTSGQFIVFRV